MIFAYSSFFKFFNNFLPRDWLGLSFDPPPPFLVLLLMIPDNPLNDIVAAPGIFSDGNLGTSIALTAAEICCFVSAIDDHN